MNTLIQKEDGIYVGRGECLIINQVFENDPTFRRNGSEQDELELVKTWEYLGCKNNVIVKRDLSEGGMIETLREFRQRLNSTCPDFMVLFVLSHGKRDAKTGHEYILDINKKCVSFTRIKNMFVDGHKCHSMVGKPKLFFIQACRGTMVQNQPNSNIRY